MLLIALIVIVRLLTMALMPVMDTTEARYSEIARIMAETGDWVTLQVTLPDNDYDQPFLAKPPLSTWLSSASMSLFGVSELSARLPSLLLGLGVAWLVFIAIRRRSDTDTALFGVVVLLSTLMYSVQMGAVMTDPSLLLSVALVMISFWLGWYSPTRTRWHYLFFVGIGLGMLAKGPVAIVLTGMPVFFWCLLQRRGLIDIWLRLPWITGIVIALAIALPWYIIAEQHTPGFWDYFFVGEHWHRFTESGWQGDRYGDAHERPRGFIWVFWLLGSLPWGIILFCIAAIKRPKPVVVVGADAVRDRAWRQFLWSWILTCLVFFTFSGNVIITYIIPILPAMALLVVEYLKDDWKSHWWKFAVVVLLVQGLILAAALVVLADESGEKAAVAHYNELTEHEGSLFYWGKRPYSAQFYSRGNARLITEEGQFAALLENHKMDFLVVKNNDLDDLPFDLPQYFTEQRHFERYSLWAEKTPGH